MIQVQNVNLGKGSFKQGLGDIYSRYDKDSVFWIIDDAIEKKTKKHISTNNILYLTISHEPSTNQVNEIVNHIKKNKKEIHCLGIIGGGSVIDIGKAVSVMLTNKGDAKDFQGWNIPKIPGITKVIFPSLAGTGAEATRSAVLNSPEKKQGINSDFCLPDAVYLDSFLIHSVPKEIEFFSGMDCYIHAVESLHGSFGNKVTRAYASSAKALCENYFLNSSKDKEDLLAASFLAGTAIMNSEVGITHVLSYGLSFLFGIPHGQANAIIFSKLKEVYGKPVDDFKKMLKINSIKLPDKLSTSFTEKDILKMYMIGRKMEKPLKHSLGKSWKRKFSKEFAFKIYKSL
ncbi:MAG: alcohol dehydrogenase [Gammaproteobacteria bacterium]|nr:alcohol dehydrogenase [Gammaproteobacteria bacterium]